VHRGARPLRAKLVQLKQQILLRPAFAVQPETLDSASLLTALPRKIDTQAHFPLMEDWYKYRTRYVHCTANALAKTAEESLFFTTERVSLTATAAISMIALPLPDLLDEN
jgi:hypothetical protein